MTKEQIIEKVRQIVVDEKFKLDAYFLCGVASSVPNQKLQKACEKYLETVDNGTPDADVTAKLIDELDAAIKAVPKVKIIGDLVNNKPDIEEVYAHRDLL